MKLEKDPFRMDLRHAKLCMELDCNTVFDASSYRHCPSCSSGEFYPLESWLNRERTQKLAVPSALGDSTPPLMATPRALWLARIRAARALNRSGGLTAPVRPGVRPLQRRRVG